MNEIYRNTYAEINLNSLYKNLLSVRKLIGNKKIIPVVKANAYGHGVIQVVEYLFSKNIDYFAVATLEEALEIREKFKSINILVMGVVSSAHFNIAAQNGITISISNDDQLFGFNDLMHKLNIHIKVDTGMNRLGFKTDSEITNALSILKTNDNIIVEGIFTHFSTADCDDDYYNLQLSRFENILNILNFEFKMVHASNSSSSIKYEHRMPFTTHVRLGISLYGLTLDDDTNFLENTYRLVTHISEIKQLEVGDKVGYGATYTATERELIGVLPIGYADGFIRKNRDSFVEINNSLYPIIGAICMDQMFIKVDKNITKEHKIIMFGNLISIDDVARRLDTINYEVICQISYRVPKIYIK